MIKHIFQIPIVITALHLFIFTSIFAQSPEKMSYQAVIRNGSNVLITNQAIGMQISILQGSISGLAVYVETQLPTSNANGLVSIEIGTGTIISGTFTDIDWAKGPYFIKTETDPKGGTNYTITGTTQLLSVPYALHAKTAEKFTGSITESDPIFEASVASSISGADTINWNNKQNKLVAGKNITIVGNRISAAGGSSSDSSGGSSYKDFYLGQDTLGGIVFYIYLDHNGIQRGLIVSKRESTKSWQWTPSITNASSSWDGAHNTKLMINSPAANFTKLPDGGFNDWYVPSIDELIILFNNRYHVNKALSAGGFELLAHMNVPYWSSTEPENDNSRAFIFSPSQHSLNQSGTKTNQHRVRGIRAF